MCQAILLCAHVSGSTMSLLLFSLYFFYMDCKTIGDYTLERRAVILSAEKPFNIGSVLHVLLTDIAFVFRNVIEFSL